VKGVITHIWRGETLVAECGAAGGVVVRYMKRVTCPTCLASVHARVGPGIDRAPCGAAGAQVRFAQTQKQIGCPTCKAARADPHRAEAQRQKMRNFHRARAASERAFLVTHRING